MGCPRCCRRGKSCDGERRGHTGQFSLGHSAFSLGVGCRSINDRIASDADPRRSSRLSCPGNELAREFAQRNGLLRCLPGPFASPPCAIILHLSVLADLPCPPKPSATASFPSTRAHICSK